ncbi:MAG: heme ABC transporter permease [Pseudomonadota bacterium]|nr:heme ABC transporter permease [Pseudomonadota bacterium]
MGWLATWYHRWASPPWFYQMSGRWTRGLMGLALPLLCVGTLWGLAFAPADYQQGNSFRIIYIHVPAAMVAQSGYILMASAGLVGLVWRLKVADVVLRNCAPIGAAMTFLALATGSIWGKPTWGAWWVWDARITSMLVLLMLYLGVMGLGSAFRNEQAAGRASAILALVGVVNIPIIKYSVEWWYSLHQPATFRLTEKPAMPVEMWAPLLVMVLGFYAFFGAVLLARSRVDLLDRERRSRWVRSLVAEHAI